MKIVTQLRTKNALKFDGCLENKLASTFSIDWLNLKTFWNFDIKVTRREGCYHRELLLFLRIFMFIDAKFVSYFEIYM